MRKKFVALIMALTLIAMPVASLASSKLVFPISRADYQGSGTVKVVFNYAVEYKKPKVTLEDDSGRTYTAKINKKHAKNLTFTVNKARPDAHYTFTLKNFRKKGDAEYTSCSFSFDIPAESKPKIKSAKYTSTNTVTVAFKGKVQFKNPKVVVKNSHGRKITSSVSHDKSGKAFITLNGASADRKYSFTLSGVCEKDGVSYQSVKGSFKTPKDEKPAISLVSYNGNGEVKLSFSNDIEYRSQNVSVTDSLGKSYPAEITKYSDKEIVFSAKDLAYGQSYSFAVSGIRVKGALDYTSAKGSFEVPANADDVQISSVIYKGNGDAEIIFNREVLYSDPFQVTITDEEGNTFPTIVVFQDAIELEALCEGLVDNKNYAVSIDSVSPIDGEFRVVEGSFLATVNVSDDTDDADDYDDTDDTIDTDDTDDYDDTVDTDEADDIYEPDDTDESND